MNHGEKLVLPHIRSCVKCSQISQWTSKPYEDWRILWKSLLKNTGILTCSALEYFKLKLHEMSFSKEVEKMYKDQDKSFTKTSGIRSGQENKC